MTSLREAGGGRPVDSGRLLDVFLERLEPRVGALRAGDFAGGTWAARQVTTGRTVRLETSAGDETVLALGVDEATGALVVADPDDRGGERRVVVGEIRHVRLDQPLHGGGVTPMPRPAFWRVDRPEEGGPRLAHLDRDRRLVEAAQADPARFEALYRKYLAQVYSYAFYELRDHHEAEDATERTFLNALANLGRFEERARPADGEGASTFRVWLFQIARNAVAERRRQRRRRPEAPLEAAVTVAAPGDLEADAALHDDAVEAWRAIGRLPGDRRRALILRFVDEMSTAEIAGVLGRSEGAVRVLIHRALRSVARDLDDPSR